MTFPLDAAGAPTTAGFPVLPAIAPTGSALLDAAESLEQILASRRVRLRFSVDRTEGLDRVVIELVDEDSGRVVRRIPPERLLRIVSGMQELAGLLVDARAE